MPSRRMHAKSASRVAQVVCLLEKQAQKLFCLDETPSVVATCIQTRPFSVVARIGVYGRSCERYLYAKIPLAETQDSAEHLKREYAAHCHVYRVFAGNEEYGVVRPVDFFDEVPALITEEEVSSSLSEFVRRRAFGYVSRQDQMALDRVARRSGEWLRGFQSIWPLPAGIDVNADKPYQTEETIDFVGDQVSQAVQRNLLGGDMGESVLRYLARAQPAMKEHAIRISGMHSDFILANMVLAGDTVKVLDFGGFKSGPSCRDVATLLYSLDRLTTHPLIGRGTIAKLKQAFLCGYGWNPDEENVPLFKVFQVREILGGLLEFSRGGASSLAHTMRRLRLKALSGRLIQEVIAPRG